MYYTASGIIAPVGGRPVHVPVFPYYSDLKELEFSLVVFDGVQVIIVK